MITPDDIARDLGIDGKALRRFLRDERNGFARPDSQKHQRWFFTRVEAERVKSPFRQQDHR